MNRRMIYIKNLLDKKDFVSTTELVEFFNVSDMTIRRDLEKLESIGVLKRVHGGAIPIIKYKNLELSHKDKQIINVDAKEHIANLAAHIINQCENENIFLGPGTTIELLCKKITNKKVNFYTNCLPQFNILLKKEMKIFLIGGEYREITMAFNGDITNTLLENLSFSKTFFSCNGILDNEITTATISEGNTQKIAIHNSFEKFLLIDESKFYKKDFFIFCKTNQIDCLITDCEPSNKFIQANQNLKILY